jgi:hypothetical protein
VRAILKTVNDDPVADAIDTVMGYAIEPSGFAPFGIRFGQGQPVNAVNYSVILGSDEDEMETDVVIIGAPVLLWTDDIQYTADGDLFITGTITNRGAEDVRAPRAIATVFDERGRVVAVGFTDANDEVLEANSETTYTLLISEMGGAAMNYIVNVQAVPCDGAC